MTALADFITEKPFEFHVIELDNLVVYIRIGEPEVIMTGAQDDDADYGGVPACCFHHASARIVLSAVQLLNHTEKDVSAQGWTMLEKLRKYRAEAEPSMQLDEAGARGRVH